MKEWPTINRQYATYSTLVSPVKMEYGWNFSISGLIMMMKSGLGKIFLKFLHALTMLFLLLNLYFWSKFSNKNDMVSAWRNFENIFPRPLFIIIFRPEMLKFHPYSILTGQSMVRFIIYCVFMFALNPEFFQWEWQTRKILTNKMKVAETCVLRQYNKVIHPKYYKNMIILWHTKWVFYSNP